MSTSTTSVSSLISQIPYPILHPFSLLPSFLRPSKIGPKPSLVLGIIFGFSLSITLNSLSQFFLNRYKSIWIRNSSSSSNRGGRGIRSIGGRKGSPIGEEEGEERVSIKSEEIIEKGVQGLIGNTPLIRINSLTDLLGGEIEILGKCEFLNPFGSVKDRVSLRIIEQAEQEGLIHPHTGSTIFEGTSGSTGISIAGIAKQRGYKAHIIVPDDISLDKIKMLEFFDAKVEKVRPVSIVDKKHYVNLARKRALEFGTTTTSTSSSSKSTSSSKEDSTHLIRSTISSTTPSRSPQSITPSSSTPDLLITQHDEEDQTTTREQARGLFSDQFENFSNYQSHSLGTGPEIFKQTSGLLDAFVSGAGTGGTIAGVGRTLKKLISKNCSSRQGQGEFEVVLADPEGSGLYYRIKEGVMWSEREEEGKRRRFQVDTIVEGIGLNRLTKNLKLALPIIDDAYRVTDSEALSMSRHLAKQDGLFLGSSSAVNLVACVRLAQRWLKEGKAEKMGLKGLRKLRIVTILCDSGNRHTSKFWNEEYLKTNGITYPENLDWLFPPPSPSSLQPSHESTIPQTEPEEEEEKEQDEGELNLSKIQDQDFASSNPKDLPPLDLDEIEARQQRDRNIYSRKKR
ncbi:hypothetical protein JCM3765_002470 [Sporobolomyces pararoseus]